MSESFEDSLALLSEAARIIEHVISDESDSISSGDSLKARLEHTNELHAQIKEIKQKKKQMN